MTARIIKGHIVNFPNTDTVEDHEHAALVVSPAGRIDWCGDVAEIPGIYNDLPVDDYGSKLVIPGFVDTHIHFPQYRILAAPGKDLLDWLHRFTFPEESKYGNDEHAAIAAEKFLDRVIDHGTTSVVAFSSSHKTSADSLFAAAKARNMALITGKTLMDINAPENVLDDVDTGISQSVELIEKWHGLDRLCYALTPRFAVTSSLEQLNATGQLLQSYPDLYMQTHLSENQKEIEQVRQQFPLARDYTDVYEMARLLGPKSLFAHGIHLKPREKSALAASGSAIIHCPTSNLFLGSGLFDLARAESEKIPVGLATDIGGGTSYSMLQTMAGAYKIAMLNNNRPSPGHLFHMATLGNAKILGLDDQIGSIDHGKWADITVLDPQATPVLADRHQLSQTINGVLFALMILGDDRAVTATYIAGRQCKKALIPDTEPLA